MWMWVVPSFKCIDRIERKLASLPTTNKMEMQSSKRGPRPSAEHETRNWTVGCVNSSHRGNVALLTDPPPSRSLLPEPIWSPIESMRTMGRCQQPHRTTTCYCRMPRSLSRWRRRRSTGNVHERVNASARSMKQAAFFMQNSVKHLNVTLGTWEEKRSRNGLGNSAFSSMRGDGSGIEEDEGFPNCRAPVGLVGKAPRPCVRSKEGLFLSLPLTTASTAAHARRSNIQLRRTSLGWRRAFQKGGSSEKSHFETFSLDHGCQRNRLVRECQCEKRIHCLILLVPRHRHRHATCLRSHRHRLRRPRLKMSPRAGGRPRPN